MKTKRPSHYQPQEDHDMVVEHEFDEKDGSEVAEIGPPMGLDENQVDEKEAIPKADDCKRTTSHCTMQETTFCVSLTCEKSRL